MKDIEIDTNIIADDNKIPDSEFKKQLSEFGLIEKNVIININAKILFQVYEKYEENLGKNNFDCDILINQYIPYIPNIPDVKILTKEELKKKIESEELFQIFEKKKEINDEFEKRIEKLILDMSKDPVFKKRKKAKKIKEKK